MSTREIDHPLEADALRDIERAVRGKLKACDLSDLFIERCIEDAIQKGLVEYFRTLDKGEVVENRNGFIVRAAFVRAIDELRREARQADGAMVDAIIDSGGVSEPPADELAIEYLQAEDLRDAVGQLSPEEQQVLSLHYFEELTAEASAEALFCSERTYRRRLKQALGKLGRLLGAPVPEPGSELAIEIGVILWVGIRGAKVALFQSPLEQIVGVAHAAHDGVVGLGAHTRDFIGRAIGSGTSERVAAVASSGPSKAAGCVLACVLAAGGAELAGVRIGEGDGTKPPNRLPIHREATKPPAPAPLVRAPAVPDPEPSANTSSPPARANADRSAPSPAARAAKREKEATEVVASQQPESAVAAPEPTPESSSPPSSSSSSTSPTEVANEQFGP
jgi:RNA polymerase sigma factor (sigma-70 family)